MAFLTTSRRIHIAKTISWRLIGLVTTCLIAGVLTGKWWAGAVIGSADGFVKLFLYYAHERAWYKWQLTALAAETTRASAE